ncbi:tRNA (adenosine(37)-N6)-threonylcarbamoyltransferase complex ATPase subunit type 1 TsaE [Chitinivibrio alkaliphilus]|uniref:tRNA threonylcarbamoyladenosine biosynthesis protein TsaE n=1 Tax=Chitinivibrio alkaliphilus ACht1 TaxID=1313304 RepID=U7D7D8_9BACT|nr:tRNA (adenosine(37)-N6)-threonylcarbamoyltransferase complex ATPase subunit type 1 TsaE [Chitinivibrio alkaliphilus]ERP38865.1 hypothetical protein CALK_0643 [Chitinivibrio alkaliphilus ACht1]
MQFTTHSAQETRLIGERLASLLSPGAVVALEGDLGSGKTELVRGYMSRVFPGEIVHSPSFSIVNTYGSGEQYVHHFDFYRLHSPDELFEIGFSEYLESTAVVFIEWADMFPHVIPPHAEHIHMRTAGEESGRIIETTLSQLCPK